ncbi:MAG: L,D-transpeptidase family protein [Eubacteriales bacterium]
MTEDRLKKTIFFSFTGIILVIVAYNLWAYQGTLLAPLIKDFHTDSPHEPITLVLEKKGIVTPVSGLWLEVVKSKHALTVYKGKTPIKTYSIALGKDYLSDKEKAGDNKMPEGKFLITEKTVFSPPRRFLGSRLFLLNYPNSEDLIRGLRQGLLTASEFLAIEKAGKEGVTPPQNTPLGGDISIHGGNSPLMGNSWTNGSAALYSKDMEEIFDLVPVGSEVVIRK